MNGKEREQMGEQIDGERHKREWQGRRRRLDDGTQTMITSKWTADKLWQRDTARKRGTARLTGALMKLQQWASVVLRGRG